MTSSALLSQDAQGKLAAIGGRPLPAELVSRLEVVLGRYATNVAAEKLESLAVHRARAWFDNVQTCAAALSSVLAQRRDAWFLSFGETAEWDATEASVAKVRRIARVYGRLLTPRRGRREDTPRFWLAINLALALRDHGFPISVARQSRFARMLQLLLRCAGAYAPADPRPLVRDVVARLSRYRKP